ncbi:MAG TPA: penicillin-binding transpeptidase domain-containing protein, partial [Solirubrobacteraceae bacterium]|nr:penicillin-binding transpeptidase domain-containing protein [Solirubrobacteraceae bacterium]
EGAYSGSNTLTGAPTFSANSISAEVGLKVGTRKIALLAHKMGITTPLSTNPAMTIGGLTVGVTPLDMAHAYETIAHGGQRVSGSMAEDGAPVGIQEVNAGGRPLPDGARLDRNRVQSRRVLPADIAQTETSMLETVLQYGTGRAAAIGQFAAGKTGTTSNYGDAWFVGWDSKYTVAVWVGYPNKLIPMTTDFNGTPVLGGTFPALIWHNFMVSALQIDKARAENAAAAKAGAGKGAGASGTSGAEEAPPSSAGAAPTPSAAPTGAGKGAGKPSAPSVGARETGGGGGAATPERAAAPSTPTPAHEAPAAPSSPPASSPTPSPSPTGGVGPAG